MRKLLCTASLLSALFAVTALAEELPQVEIAPVVGAQFFRGINGPGFGEDQMLQNGVVLGGRAGALFGDRLRLELGFDFIPTMAVGIDRITYVLHPHFDASIDADTGWIRPYLGVGVGTIGFVDNEWVADGIGAGADDVEEVKPDVEFSGHIMVGARVYMGEIVDMLDDTIIRVDVRDILYAPRNGTVNYMQNVPGSLVAFNNLQCTLSFAWVFDAFGEGDEGDYYEGKSGFSYR